MGRKDDHVTMRLVDQDEFEEQSLSDGSDDQEEKKLERFRITRGSQSAMGAFMQVVVYMMFMSVMMGVCMLTLHIVARTDPNRLVVISVGLAAAWITFTNVLALASFVIDKYHAFNSQPRMSESLALTHYAIGGVLGGWLAFCLTCYRPPGMKKLSGFICRAMLCSLVGISLIVVLVLKVILPNLGVVSAIIP